MCEFQASGPSHILVLTKGDFGENILEEWLEVLGPPSVADAQEYAATRCVCLCVWSHPYVFHVCHSYVSLLIERAIRR